jgi:hypothetical protein
MLNSEWLDGAERQKEQNQNHPEAGHVVQPSKCKALSLKLSTTKTVTPDYPQTLKQSL